MEAGHRGGSVRTLRAMIVPVVTCFTLLTVPPFPDPSSLMISRSSGRKSSLYSIPISSWPSLLGSSRAWSDALLVSAVGGGLGAEGVKARPLTFLRFMVRGANGSAMATIGTGRQRGRTVVEVFSLRGARNQKRARGSGHQPQVGWASPRWFWRTVAVGGAQLWGSLSHVRVPVECSSR